MFKLAPSFVTTVSSKVGVATPTFVSKIGRVRAGRADAKSGMLFAALLAAVLVVANQVIESFADGHLLVSWMALWSVTFLVLAWAVMPLRMLTKTISKKYSEYVQEREENRLEGRLWELAKHNPRVMEELSSAVNASER